MNQYIITESSIHYVKGFLERYKDQYPSKKHADALKEFTQLSDMLIESLQQPFAVKVIRHNLKK